MARDPWDVLGVAKTATDDEIKRAYKKEAMQHHPDRGGNEEKFKECTLAYNSIKDAQSRAQYQQEQMGSRGFRGHQEPRFQNRDINLRYSVTLSESHTGATKLIKVKMPDGSLKPISVDIPKGVDTGHKIRYNALGERRYDNAPPGDLYINVTVTQDDDLRLGKFRKLDQHLETSVTIDPVDAMLGCDRIVDLFDGGQISLKIHPGTQPGTKLRIPEQGTYALNDNRRGDLFVEIRLQIPKIKTKQDLIDLINAKVNK